jgi:broad specificity phosphatase PhoE
MIDNCLAPEDFDQRYTSPFYRTMETAAKLGGEKSTWLPEVAIVERDWGLYGATPKKDRDEIFETVNHMKDTSSFFARLTNGESILDVNFRVRDFLGKLSREAAGLRVIAVTHGELMWTARFVIERMMPYEWQDLEANKSLRLGNCSILQYSRTNPSDPDDIVESLSSGWRRIYDPVNPERSPYKGDWHKLVGKRYISVGEISRIVEQRPRLIEASG